MTNLNITLTEDEATMLAAFIDEGRDCIGATDIEDLLQDNMTWMSGRDLMEALGWNGQKVGGVMASLSAKCLIADSGESARGAMNSDWYATDDGIKIGWQA